MSKYKYVRVTPHNQRILEAYPNAGPHPNITGMRRLYWGKEAFIIKCGAYAYKVPQNIFYMLD